MFDTLATTPVLDLVAALDDTDAVAFSPRPGRTRPLSSMSRRSGAPLGLRSAVTQDEIRRADERHNAAVIAEFDEAFFTAQDRFEGGCIDVDEFRRIVRAASAQRDRRLVGDKRVIPAA